MKLLMSQISGFTTDLLVIPWVELKKKILALMTERCNIVVILWWKITFKTTSTLPTNACMRKIETAYVHNFYMLLS